MKIYEAKLSDSTGCVREHWFLRAKDFTVATEKATRTSLKKDKHYVTQTQLASVSLIGKEE